LSERYFQSLNAEALASLASMEGLDAPAPGAAVFVTRPPAKASPQWYGYAASAAVAAIAYLAHTYYAPLSAAIVAILLGALIRNLSLVPPQILEGCKNLVKRTIPATIVLTGATLNLADLAKGVPYLAVVMAAVIVGTLAAILAGRILGASQKTSMLIGAGTSICGNSAIVAVAPVLHAADDDLLLSVGTINVLGLAIMLLLPLAGSGLSMAPESFGVWAGATVHAVPQAVTAGFAFGPEAGALAALVKLVRVSLLAPYVLFLALWIRRTEQGEGKVRYASLIPPFLWGFAAFAVIRTLALWPELVFQPLGASQPSRIAVAPALATLGNLLLTLSMAAMGLEVNLRHLLRTGGPAMVTGLVTSGIQCLVTWLLIRILL
jgi:uncharacterized integral membrane protein (TIGR00698 family)